MASALVWFRISQQTRAAPSGPHSPLVIVFQPLGPSSQPGFTRSLTHSVTHSLTMCSECSHHAEQKKSLAQNPEPSVNIASHPKPLPQLSHRRDRSVREEEHVWGCGGTRVEGRGERTIRPWHRSGPAVSRALCRSFAHISMACWRAGDPYYTLVGLGEKEIGEPNCGGGTLCGQKALQQNAGRDRAV